MNDLQQRLIDLLGQRTLSTAQLRTNYLVATGKGIMLSKLALALSDMLRSRWIKVVEPGGAGYSVTLEGFAERDRARERAGEAKKGVPLPQVTQAAGGLAQRFGDIHHPLSGRNMKGGIR